MIKIGVKAFRNNFCSIYKGRESYIVTNRGKIVGIYNPSGAKELMCESQNFTGQKCPQKATYFVRASKEDYNAQGNLCVSCHRRIKLQEAIDSSLKIEERML
jgi:hypothetical protein